VTAISATCSNIFDTSGTVGFGFSVFVDGNSYTFICKPGYTTTSGSTSQTYNCNGQTWDILFKKCYRKCNNDHHFLVDIHSIYLCRSILENL